MTHRSMTLTLALVFGVADAARAQSATEDTPAASATAEDAAPAGDAKATVTEDAPPAAAAKEDEPSTDAPSEAKTADEPSEEPEVPSAKEPAAAPTSGAEPTAEEPATETTSAAPVDTGAPEAKLATEQPQDEAVFLHAEAIEADVTHDPAHALELLRRAHELSPADSLIRFDLARIALLRGGTQEDLQPFLATTLDDEASTLLREVIEAELTGPPERLRLFDGRLTARLRLGTSIDTNVAITPTDATAFDTGERAPTAPLVPPTEQLLGVRLVSEGQIAYTPIGGMITVDIATTFRLGTFLNSGGNTLHAETGTRTARLERFDSNRISLAALGRLDLEPFYVNLLLSGTEVAFENFGEHFMQSLDTHLEILFGSPANHIGFYGSAGYRDFVDGNRDGTPEDRDGPYAGTGLAGDWNTAGTVGFAARLGMFREWPQGDELEVWGALGSLVLVTNAGPVHGELGINHQARVYYQGGPGDWSDVKDLRVDNRLNPFARVTVDVWDYVGFYGLYSYVNNLSTHEENIMPRVMGVPLHIDRRYERHFIEFGVEGRI